MRFCRWNPDTPAPARGCEVFVGNIPRDCYEDELVPVFEQIGSIYELRLMMDYSGSNRGYCFVMFTSREDAKRAVQELNNFEIRTRSFLGVSISVDNCRLYVGRIPKNRQRDEILQAMKKLTEGVVDVIVYPNATDKTINRGFAFVEYESHRAAVMACRKLLPGQIRLWGHLISVDWAEPEQEVDEDVMAKVKILFVRNLMLNTTEENLMRIFNKACNKEGAVHYVTKPRDYAFVYFKERDDAIMAMRLLNGNRIDGAVVEVTFAKPLDKSNHVCYARGGGRGDIAQVSAAVAGIPRLYPASAPATPYSTRYAPSPATATGYTPNAGHMSVRGSLRGGGLGDAGSRGAGAVGRGCVPSYIREAPELLDNICSNNGWGRPVYQLHSAVNCDGAGDMQHFFFEVCIPALTNQYPNNTFSPNKLSRTAEEAKTFAAEYVLLQLGMPIESNAFPQYPRF